MEHQPLHIQLLGTFQVRAGVTPLPAFHAPRLQALLACLLLHRDAPLPRRQIAFWLWPDSPEAQALTNLRHLLHQIRHALPDGAALLAAEGALLAWRAALPCRLDVADFERALDQADQAARQGQPAATRAALEAALAAYGGDLLPGCYDEWILPERERLRQRFLASLERLVVLLEAQRAYAAAIPYARRLVQAEPLHEAGYLHLLRLYALTGDRAAALHTYQTCAATLRRDLAVEPGLPLREAYVRLRAGQPLAPYGGAPPGSPSLVGRRAEWRQLLHAWQAATAGPPRLLVISGEAGSGKTRLAEELLHWAEQQGFATARAPCYAAEGDLAYAPLCAWLRAPGIAAARAVLAPCWRSEVARLLPEARDAPASVPAPGPLGEPWQRQRLCAALRQALLAAGQPLLLLLDDLQWCDPASLTAVHICCTMTHPTGCCWWLRCAPMR